MTKIIASIGYNWWAKGGNGFERAKLIVDEAVTAGVDGICIPLFKAGELYRDKEQVKAYRHLDRANDWIADLYEYVKAYKKMFYVSPRFVSDWGAMQDYVDGYHVVSGDIKYKPLLERLVGEHVLLSTGGATDEEINEAVESLLGDLEPAESDLVLLHSTGGLPTPSADAQLRRILDLGTEFYPLYVGLESTFSEPALDFIAMAFNPEVIMRRLDLGDDAGLETDYSLSPSQMATLVLNSRALGMAMHPIVNDEGFTRSDWSSRLNHMRCAEGDYLLPPKG